MLLAVGLLVAPTVIAALFGVTERLLLRGGSDLPLWAGGVALNFYMAGVMYGPVLLGAAAVLTLVLLLRRSAAAAYKSWAAVLLLLGVLAAAYWGGSFLEGVKAFRG